MLRKKSLRENFEIQINDTFFCVLKNTKNVSLINDTYLDEFGKNSELLN
jgi:hypothetical protein